ncbi:hypothetical protein [Shewanella phaeophyticola]|uniref:Uncharacterized protein n=1 Tax=Shewanella phaeophyticola TaxID=2978345 RepID=A0ABT2P926_9GAMM|nr:hypothetical protein [Shewanella sp. KJ10-1]MCT8988075.1 hypothetical protein [Shewanella sp. KJ10-1]
MSEEKAEHKVKHGGFRTGAGRKTKYEKTVVMRVPEKYKDAIKSLIKHLVDCEMIDKNYSGVKSEPIFIRSLQDKPQKITFIVNPVSKS